ncbi:MAG: hypothetical protein WDN06_22260 [Asticcacaulis sp.]
MSALSARRRSTAATGTDLLDFSTYGTSAVHVTLGLTAPGHGLHDGGPCRKRAGHQLQRHHLRQRPRRYPGRPRRRRRADRRRRQRPVRRRQRQRRHRRRGRH